MATTTDEKTLFDVSRSKTQTVRTAPRLARLSVSLVIDDSLAQKREEIVEIVKAAVGFDEGRKDVIGVSTTTFAIEELPEGAEGADDVGAPPNPTTELLLTRGVEIVAALGFVVLLLLSLKGGASKRGASAPSGAAGTAGPGTRRARGGSGTDDFGLEDEEEIDPALVAQVQIEELVKTDPRRVSEILSRWASEEAGVK
jgi:flagellar biosynthesis/type III secretory pathway M-ring protein FliF/YscJ